MIAFPLSLVLSVGGIVPVFNSLSSGIPRRMLRGCIILVQRSVRVSEFYRILLSYQGKWDEKRELWSPERLSVCEAKGYRASKAPGGAHGSLLNDGLAVLSGERFMGPSEPGESLDYI